MSRKLRGRSTAMLPVRWTGRLRPVMSQVGGPPGLQMFDVGVDPLDDDGDAGVLGKRRTVLVASKRKRHRATGSDDGKQAPPSAAIIIGERRLAAIHRVASLRVLREPAAFEPSLCLRHCASG